MEAAGPAVFVNRKFAGFDTPETVAATVYCGPAVVLAVKIADVAMPDALVVAVLTLPANVPLGPLAGAVNVTTVPAPTGLPFESLTVTTRGAKAVPTAMLCGVPLVAVTEAAAPTVLVSRKLAGVATPETVAATVYCGPAVVLAVKIAEVAMPEALVIAVLRFPAKVPLGPLAGAVKVTVAPLTGLPPTSLTRTTKGANGVPLVTL
jgi:hypothetical protein